MASSQSFSMIQRRILHGPEPASPVNSGEPLKTMAISSLRRPSPGGGLHLGNHVLQEQQRAVIDARQAGAEASREAQAPRAPWSTTFCCPSTPHQRADWPACSETACPGSRRDVLPSPSVSPRTMLLGLLVLDQHVGAADRPGTRRCIPGQEAEVGAGVLAADRSLPTRTACRRCRRRGRRSPIDARLVNVFSPV